MNSKRAAEGHISPKFYVGEIVRWMNVINSKYVKIAVVYKLETDDGNVFFRYAGLKQQRDNRWEYLEKAVVNIIFDEDELYKRENDGNRYYTEMPIAWQQSIALESIKFESYNPKNICLNIITKPNSNNLFAINFKNTINSKIKIKSICESSYSKHTTIMAMAHTHRYYANSIVQECETKFINLKTNTYDSNWKEYTDVDTLDKMYVNHIHKITSKENPKTFLTHDIDECVEHCRSPDIQYSWIKTFRKLILLLESKQCDHIIDIIKECLIPHTKFCFGDIVYNNSYAGPEGLSNIFLEERNRTAKSLNFIVNDIFLIKDHNKLWKPRYLLITLETNYNMGWCDENTLDEVKQYKQIVYNKIRNLSQYKDNGTEPINKIWDDDVSVTYKTKLNKKRKIMKVNSCLVTKTYKQYRSDVYNKKLVCNRVVEPLF